MHLYYFTFLENKRVLFEYDLINNQEKEIIIDFLKENLLDKKSYSILSGFSLNKNNYFYVAVWRNNKQIDNYWLKFGKNINKNYKKLTFKGFSYNINILSSNLVLIGNKLVNL